MIHSPSSWWAAVISILVGSLIAGIVLYRAYSSSGECRDVIISESPSPNQRLKVIESTPDCGATVSSYTIASIVDSLASDSRNGCEILIWDPRHFAGGHEPIVEVAWKDDSRIVLRYPAHLELHKVVAQCAGIDVEHRQKVVAAPPPL
jgi:hypothetical protein